METIFTVVYVLEAGLKITVEGWKRYSESPRNMFDFVITLLAVLATAYVYCKTHLLSHTLGESQCSLISFQSFLFVLPWIRPERL